MSLRKPSPFCICKATRFTILLPCLLLLHIRYTIVITIRNPMSGHHPSRLINPKPVSVLGAPSAVITLYQHLSNNPSPSASTSCQFCITVGIHTICFPLHLVYHHYHYPGRMFTMPSLSSIKRSSTPSPFYPTRPGKVASR